MVRLRGHPRSGFSSPSQAARGAGWNWMSDLGGTPDAAAGEGRLVPELQRNGTHHDATTAPSAAALLGRDSGQVHREQHTGFGELLNADDGSGGPVLAHTLDVGTVHRVEVAHLLEEHVDVDDVRQVRPDGLEHPLDV